MFTHWVNADKVTLYVSKSNVDIIPPHSKKYTHSIFSFTDIPELSIVNEAKYLCVVIDKSRFELYWSYQTIRK